MSGCWAVAIGHLHIVFIFFGREKMNDSSHNVLKLMAFADCFDNVSEQVSAAVTKNQVGGLR